MIFKNSIGRDLDTDEDTGKQQEKTYVPKIAPT